MVGGGDVAFWFGVSLLALFGDPKLWRGWLPLTD